MDACAEPATDRVVGSAHRACLGLFLVFLVTGAISATWAARLAEIKETIGASERDLAIALLVWNAGAIAGLQAGGLLVPRFHSRRCLAVSLPAFALSLCLLGPISSTTQFALVVFAVGCANGVVDVGMNAHGIVLEQASGDRLLSRLHAMHPIGGIAGGGVAIVAAGAGMPLASHFAISGLALLAAAIAALRMLGPQPYPAPASAGGHESQRGGWTLPVIGFGMLAFCVTLAEGSMVDWSAVYLREDVRTGTAVAAAGTTTFLAGIALGRLAGDRITRWLGPSRAFRLGGIVASCGLALAVVIGTPWAGLIGIGCCGLGISYLLPLLLGTAARDGSDPARVVARVSTLGYAGSFTGPVVIGSVAGIVGLPVALTIPAALLITAVALARIGASTGTEARPAAAHRQPC